MSDYGVNGAVSAVHVERMRWRGVFLVVACVAFALYCVTLYPGVGARAMPGDAAKFQYIPAALGVPHAPGFVPYVVAGWLWSRFPLPGGLAARMNLLSAVCAAAAIWLFMRTLHRCGAPLAAAVLTGAGLALSPWFWRRATEAGPGMLTVLMCIAAVDAWARWRTGSRWALAAGMALALAACLNDTHLLWLLPLAFVYVIMAGRGAPYGLQLWLGIVAGCACWIVAFIFVYIRSRQGAPGLEYVLADAPAGRVAAFLLGAQFWPNWFQEPAAGMVRRVLSLPREALRMLNIGGVALAVLGIVTLVRASRAAGIALVCAAVAAIACVAHEYAVDIRELYWPAWLALMYAVGLGLGDAWARGAASGWFATAVYGALLVSASAVTWPGMRRAPNPYEIERLLLAAPGRAVLLVNDVYTWQEVTRYYAHTDRFVAGRAVTVSDAYGGVPGGIYVFFDPQVARTIREAGLPSVALYHEDGRTLRAIGTRRAPGDQ